LVIASTVDLTSETVELGDSSTLDGGSDDFAGGSDSVHQDHKIVVMRRGHDKPIESWRILLWK
jgi:hypothetical protein